MKTGNPPGNPFTYLVKGDIMTMTTFGLCFILLLAILAWATRLDNSDLEDRIEDQLDELQRQIKALESKQRDLDLRLDTHFKNHHTSDLW